MTDRIQGQCPACHGSSLFVAEGGYITCSRLDCPDPEAVTTLLERSNHSEAAPEPPLATA